MKAISFRLIGACSSIALSFALYSSPLRELPARGETAPASKPMHRTGTQQPILFSSLDSATETAVLDYTLAMCFSSNHYRLEYSSFPTPHVTVTDLFGHSNGKQKERVGIVTLTPQQVARLDNLLQSYRANPSKNSPSTEKVTFAVFRGQHKISSEYFVSNSGVSWDLEDATPEDIQAIHSSCYPGCAWNYCFLYSLLPRSYHLQKNRSG